MNWSYEMRIPHGSADGEWVVFDLDSDNKDIVAMVDPEMICEGLCRDPADYARLIAAAPKMLAALIRLRDCAVAISPDDAELSGNGSAKLQANMAIMLATPGDAS